MWRYHHGLAFTIARQRLFFWVLLLGFANVLVDKAVRSVATTGWAASIGELFQVSAIIWVAITVSLVLIGKSRETTPATATDTVVALLVIVATLLPVGAASRIAAAGAAAYLLWTSPRRSAEWRAAAIAVSTGAYFVIGPVLLRLFADELAFVDAWLVAVTTGLEQRGDLVAMRDRAGWLQIFSACSSLHAVSLSVVLPVTYSQWFRIADWRAVTTVCASTAVAMIAFNVARLSALAAWPSHFDLLHAGWGSSAIATATLIVMLAMCYVGFERAQR